MARLRIVVSAPLLLALAACRGGEKAPETARASSSSPVVSQGAMSVPARTAPAAPPVEAVPAASPVGKYVVELPAADGADAAGRRVSLDLRPDSTCVLKTERLGKGQHVESGTWTRNDGFVRIVIGPPRDPSKQKKLAFTARGDSLVCAQWDTVFFGTEGLGTLVRR